MAVANWPTAFVLAVLILCVTIVVISVVASKDKK